MSPDMRSPEFLGTRQTFDVGRRMSCEEEALRPPTPPPPLPEEPIPPFVPRKEVITTCSLQYEVNNNNHTIVMSSTAQSHMREFTRVL